MKRKLVISWLMATIFLVGWATPAFAALGVTGIDYNFDAAPNEDALTIRWIGRPWAHVHADEFQLQQGEATITDVEYRLKEKIYDFLREDVAWNQLDPEEEPYLSGELSWGEEIIWDGNKQYLRTWKGYFSIHIFSLDDLETPESELNFTTKFVQKTAYPGGTPQEVIFSDGWWN